MARKLPSMLLATEIRQTADTVQYPDGGTPNSGMINEFLALGEEIPDESQRFSIGTP